MAWTTLSFPFGSLLTSTKMTQLYDNLTALANGDTNAPPVKFKALDVTSIPSQVVSDTTNYNMTIAHGLSRFPNRIDLMLVCNSDDSTWLVGDRVPISPNEMDIVSTDRGWTTRVDTENVYFYINQLMLSNSAHNITTLGEAKWSLQVNVW